MLSVGDFVFDTIEKANVQILEKIEAWGYTSYKVFNPATGRVYKANEDSLAHRAVRCSMMKIICAMLRCSLKSKTKLPVVSFLLLPAGLFRCRTSSMC